MKIVILAAGIGSRLGNPLPKPLTVLNSGQSIMELQLANISKFFNPQSVMTVVGYKKDIVMESFPEVLYVYNQRFDQTNTSKSLLAALHKAGNEGVLWMNGDVVFDGALFSVLLPYIQKEQSFMCVNNEECGEEEVKYRTGDSGMISEISKEVEHGQGEAIGINYISAGDLPFLIKRLEEVADGDYFEAGIERMIQLDDAQVLPVNISSFNCMEVDFKEDLENANRLF